MLLVTISKRLYGTFLEIYLSYWQRMICFHVAG